MRRTAVLGPAVAGSWYPLNRDELTGAVDALVESASARVAAAPEPVAALVVPHAGFAYSGGVAASAFSTLRRQAFDRVVLIGPSHHFAFEGAAITDAATAFHTPLGDALIDGEAVQALREAPGFLASDRMFEPEHALEVELPFLQRVLAHDVRIVPVLLGGGATHADAGRVAEALARFVHPSTLFVVSSDFTHYGPRFGYVPFEDNVPASIRRLDLGAIAAIEDGDALRFARYVESTGATICGHRAIDVLLLLHGKRAGARLLEYDTSGRMTGAWDHSVSYAAIAVPATGDAVR